MYCTVFVIPLDHGLQIAWICDDSRMRVPVIEFETGNVRPVNSPTDNIKFCEAVDTVLTMRQAGTFSEGLLETSPNVFKRVMKLEDTPTAHWVLRDWTDIVFASYSVSNPSHYKSRVEAAKKLSLTLLEAHLKMMQSAFP